MTTRYKRGNQKPSIEEGQTTLWLQYTKGVIISRQSKKDRQHYDYTIPKGNQKDRQQYDYSHIVVSPASIDGFWWPLWYLLDILLSVLVITPLVSCSHIVVWPSDYPLVSCSHSVVCPSSFDGLWLPLWYIVVIVLSVLLFDWRLLITPLVSCSHIFICPSSFDGFWLPLWYLVVILLSVRLITPLVSCSHIVVCPSDYPFSIV
jgi:hypothetical protein